MATVINAHAANRTFIKCMKSAISKQSKVTVPKKFRIAAQSRGKELMMTLTPIDSARSSVYVLCAMGMTGFFEPSSSLKSSHKHAHLKFVASDGSVLSFVDPWRFGSWRQKGSFEWSKDRGPCPVKEHAHFRRAVADAVSAKPKRFADRPICQVMHDQTLFNGIGNYLRAEVLHRAGVPPFASALEALGSLPAEATENRDPDLLTLCRDVAQEVLNLKMSKYKGGKDAKSEDGEQEQGRWQKWCRVYSHDDASWAVDKQGRRIWYHGAPGKLMARFASKSSESNLTEQSSSKKSTRKKRPSDAKSASKSVLKRPAAESKKAPASKKPRVGKERLSKKPAAVAAK